MELEAWAERAGGVEAWEVGAWDLGGLWRALDADRGELAARARRFHATLARWTSETASELAEQEGVETVVLGGGVFQNVLLLGMVREQLEAKGLRVLSPRALPPNDGGLALGQLYLAALTA